MFLGTVGVAVSAMESVKEAGQVSRMDRHSAKARLL
jgi:hypothetical protein